MLYEAERNAYDSFKNRQFSSDKSGLSSEVKVMDRIDLFGTTFFIISWEGVLMSS